jgi:trimeric autotransporter adhesin
MHDPNSASFRIRRQSTRMERGRRMAFESLEERLPLAIDFSLVKDLNPTQVPSNWTYPTTRDAIEINGLFHYFSGTVLISTDGTVANTKQIFDLQEIKPGEGNVSSLFQLNQQNYLVITSSWNPNLKSNLWITNGTKQGTQLLQEFSTHLAYFSPLNGYVYFLTAQGDQPTALWRTNGTSSGTQVVPIDVNGQAPNSVFAIRDKLYFTGFDSEGVSRYWQSNGTNAGTTMLPLLSPPTDVFLPSSLPSLPNDTLTIRNISGSLELWSTDGTEAGTVLVKDLSPNNDSSFQNYSNLAVLDNAIYFTVQNKVSGTELWKSDGTAAGTTVLGAANGNVNSLSASDNRVYFVNYPSDKTKLEIWSSDGTVAGTKAVSQLTKDSLTFEQSVYFTHDGGQVYFVNKPTAETIRLWKFQEQTETTHVVRDIATKSWIPAYNLKTVNHTLYFSAPLLLNTSQEFIDALWSSNGTAAGTQALVEFNNLDSWPTDLTTVGQDLYYTAQADEQGNRQLFKTTAGSNLTTQLTLPLVPQSPGDFNWAQGMANVNGSLFFFYSDSGINAELWKSDGTVAGTQLVKDIYPGPNGSGFSDMINFNGTLFFSARNEFNRTELWKSDGTAAGTVQITNVDQTTVGGGASPRQFFVHENELYFTAVAPNQGFELWKSDGTTAGTVLVKDINPGPGESYPRYFSSRQGELFFTATTPNFGRELWKTDGTAAGTVMVKDINPGTADGLANWLKLIGDQFYFTANDGVHGNEVWKSDGTAAGTKLLKDSNLGTAGIHVGVFGEFNNQIFFTRITHSVDGNFLTSQLWRTDGTSAGTVEASEIVPGPNWNVITYDFIVLNSKMYFTADDGVHGAEPWVTDGTAAGTKMLKDVNPGRASSYLGVPNATVESNPYQRIGDTIFWILDDGKHGVELWSFRDSNVTTLIRPTAAGNIEIRDALNTNDSYVLTHDGPYLYVSNNSSAGIGVEAVGIPGAVQVDFNTVKIPWSAVEATDKPLLINAGDGDDYVALTTNGSASDVIPNASIVINFGTGEDTFDLVNNSTTNRWLLSAWQSGSVSVGSLGTVNFNGVEHVRGGASIDQFVIKNGAANGITSFDGDGNSALNSVEVWRDANFKLTNFNLEIDPLLAGKATQSFTIRNIAQALLIGGDGANTINASAFTGIATLKGANGDDVLLGGSGNDRLEGGWGNDWIGGNAGIDLLLGAQGSDILVGGTGQDKLNDATIADSDAGSDLLVGARTKYDNNLSAIATFMASWSTTQSAAVRIQTLQSVGVGIDKIKINTLAIIDDDIVDQLYGGRNTDWFLAEFVVVTPVNKEQPDLDTLERTLSVDLR